MSSFNNSLMLFVLTQHNNTTENQEHTYVIYVFM